MPRVIAEEATVPRLALSDVPDQRLRTLEPDAWDLDDARVIRPRLVRCRRIERRAERGATAECPCQVFRRLLADVTDAEREQEPFERNLAPSIDRGKQIVDRLLTEPFFGAER